jgi:hypothetical protein
MATDKTLRAVIDFLLSKAADGAMEPGRAKAFTKVIRKFRRAIRTGNLKQMSAAADEAAKLFLKNF